MPFDPVPLSPAYTPLGIAMLKAAEYIQRGRWSNDCTGGKPGQSMCMIVAVAYFLHGDTMDARSPKVHIAIAKALDFMSQHQAYKWNDSQHSRHVVAERLRNYAALQRIDAPALTA